jgi:glycosyltransferase involved in cell wall biosynthesis
VTVRVRQVVGISRLDGTTGGVLPVALELAKGLTAAGVPNSIFTLSDDERVSALPDSDVLPARLLPGRLGIRAAWHPMFVRRALSDLHPETILHIHGARDLTTMAVARRAARLGVPYVLQTHGTIRLQHVSRALRLFDNHFTGPAISGAACVLTLTEREETAMSARWPEASFERIFNAVNLELPVPPDRVFLFAGRLARSKNPDLVALAQSPAGFRVVLAGPLGDVDRGFLVEVERDPRVTWLGSLDRAALMRTMSEAWALVLPSLDDPFPMSVVEAAAAGVPCIVHRSNGLAQLVSDWSAGLVLDDLSVTAVEAALEEMSDPLVRERLSRGAQRMIAAELDMSSLVGRLMEIYSRGLTLRR